MDFMSLGKAVQIGQGFLTRPINCQDMGRLLPSMALFVVMALFLIPAAAGTTEASDGTQVREFSVKVPSHREMTMTDLQWENPSSITVSGTEFTVMENITISQFGTLSIKPGERVRFASGKGLFVEGALYVNGTESSGCTLTGQSHSEVEQWIGIVVDKNLDGRSCVLKHTTVEYCMIVLDVTGSTVYLESCEFNHFDDRGIYSKNSDLEMRACRMVGDHKTEYGLWVDDQSDASVSGCEFRNLYWGIRANRCEPLLEGNTFQQCMVGIYVFGVMGDEFTTNVANGTFNECNQGIYALGGRFVARSNDFDRNTNAVVTGATEDSGPTRAVLIGNAIRNSKGYAVYTFKAEVNLVDNTMDHNGHGDTGDSSSVFLNVSAGYLRGNVITDSPRACLYVTSLLPGSPNIVLENNTLESGSRWGIWAQYSKLHMTSNRISSCGGDGDLDGGLIAFWTNVYMEDNTVEDTQGVGVMMDTPYQSTFYTAPVLRKNTIRNSQREGVVIQNFPPDRPVSMYDNLIETSGRYDELNYLSGIKMTKSTVKMEGGRVNDTRGYGLLMVGDAVLEAEDLEVENSGFGDMYMMDGSNATLTDCALDQDTINQDMNTSLIIRWKVMITVQDPSGLPVEGATVNITDKDGIVVGSVETGEDGSLPGEVTLVQWSNLLTEEDGYYVSDGNPFRIHAASGDYGWSQEAVILSGGLIVVTVHGAPDLTVLTLEEGEEISFNWTVRGTAFGRDENVTAMGYRIDDGDWIELDTTPDISVEWSFPVNPDELSEGDHALHIRASTDFRETEIRLNFTVTRSDMSDDDSGSDDEGEDDLPVAGLAVILIVAIAVVGWMLMVSLKRHRDKKSEGRDDGAGTSNDVKGKEGDRGKDNVKGTPPARKRSRSSKRSKPSPRSDR